MPRDSGYPQREENPQQGANHSFGTPARDETARTDRERSIETGRDRARQTPSVGRPDAISPALGWNASSSTLMRRLADDVNRIFNDFGFASTLESTGWSPQVESFRRGKQFVIRADLPGLKKEDVKIEVQNGVVSISGERRSEREEKRDDFYRSERSYGQFCRALSLPDNVKDDDVNASFQNGVLEVTFATSGENAGNKKKEVPIR